MRYDPRFDPDEPNEPELIISSDDVEHTPPRIGRLLILLGLLFGGFLLVHNVVPLYTDWLWFGEVGYRNVFTTTIATKTLLFFSGALLFFAVFYLNVRHARRLAPEDTDRFLRQQFGAQWGQTIQNGIGWILLGVGAFLSLWAGRIAAESWQNWLQFRYWTPFRITDPVFGNDVGFYIFRLPFLDFLWQFGFYTLVLTTAAVLFLHWVGRAIDSLSGLPSAAAGVRGHVLALLAALTAMGALGFSLSRYDLLLNENGVFTGAGYADLRYRLFAIYAQTVLLALTALACLAAIWQGRSFRWPTIGVGAWLTALILLGNVVPALMQKI
ncbi:MAG TPA: UPF0182 family protein, partial [Chthonomonadaceae bacterium]|nr:UPF0182 family protein [Chthonomonadaceae bacterium]